MTKRFLDCNTSDFQKMSKGELLDAIRASEGRVIITEVIGAVQPLLYHISNAELPAPSAPISCFSICSIFITRYFKALGISRRIGS